jgi:serine/threonine-protein kinase
MGSVHYISPEQARGGYSDERSDIYSFGITLYEMLTGKVPFDGDTTVAVAVQHIQDEIPAPSELTPDIPSSVDKIVLKCTQKKTERRYQSAYDLIIDLKKALTTPNEDFVKIAPMYDKVQPAADTQEEEQEEDFFNDDDDFDDDDDLDDIGKPEKKKYKPKDEADIDIDDENNDKLDKMVKWIGVGIIAVILIIAVFVVVKLVGGVSIGSSKTTEATTTENQTTTESSKDKVTVPDLKDKTEEQAKEELNKLGLGFKSSTQASSTVDAGKVISQNVKSGTSVEKNTTVTVVISSGPASVSVPNVTGKSESSATSSLKASGFTVNVEYEYSDTVDQGNVISQNPTGSAGEGDTVTITVSQGKKVSYVTVPNVIGMTEDAAKKTLEDQGLVASVVYQTTSGTYGQVTSQGYNSGDSLAKGTTVTIVVSHYQKQTEATTAAPTTQSTTAAQAESTTAAP